MGTARWAWLFALIVGCSYPRPEDVTHDDAGGDGVMPDAATTLREVALIPSVQNRDVDILFLIDDSPSMTGMQDSTKASFPAMLAVLDNLPLGLPNVHIGVATSDLGTKGAEDAAAGPGIGGGPGACSGNGKSGNLQTNGTTLVTGTFISDTRNSDGTRTKNYTGTLEAAFGAIASVGAGGCGFEQHIEAAKRALDNNPANAGFLRQNAGLVVIIVGDEDDCSMAHSTLLDASNTSLGPLQSFRCTRFGITCDVGGTTSDEMNNLGSKSACHSNESSPYLTKVDSYEAFFKGLKSVPSTVMFAAISGAPMPFVVEERTPPGGGSPMRALARHCTSTERTVDPAVRLSQAIGPYSRSTWFDACNGDLSDALEGIGRQIRTLVGDSCIPIDIATPSECVAVDITGAVETEYPPCGGATITNCHQIVTDPMCPGTQQLRFQVMRTTSPPPGTLTSLRCP